MKHLMPKLVLATAVAGAAGCAGGAHEQASAGYTSPMYTAELTQTCAYKDGPKAGRTVDYSGATGSSAVAVGSRCADMNGSSGWAVPQQPGREQGGRFYASPGAPSPQGPSGALQPGYSLYCRFNSGPAAGQTADYSSTLGARPVAIGSTCSDGPNRGVAVGSAAQTSQPPQ